MKKVSLLFLLCLLPGAFSPASGQTITKCFSADWLQGERIVNLSLDGDKVSGTFSVGSGGGSDPDATYNFSGTRRGNILNVAFANNELPDVAPSEMKSLAWALVRAGGKESLRIKFSGKNYDTNKYEESFAYFAPCKPRASEDDGRPGYADLVKTAKIVRFAKGANAATESLDSLAEFQAMKAPATFLINAAKSQMLDIKAIGCTIEIYLPNRKRYRYVESEVDGEKFYGTTQLDMMTIDELPLTGNYLIVLRKPNEVLEPETVTIKITNSKTRKKST